MAKSEAAKWVVPDEAGLQAILAAEKVKSVTLKFSCALMEPMLGTVPMDKDLFSNYVADKMGSCRKPGLCTIEDYDEEMSTFPEGRGATGFHTDENGIFIYNYVLLGSIKSNIYILQQNDALAKITAYKKQIDLCLEALPRRVRFYRDGKPITEPEGVLERSVRAMTAKGERTFLSKSDLIKEGAKFSFHVRLLKNKSGLTAESVVEAVKMGKLHGLGQWRGSGKYGKYKILTATY